MHKSAPGWTLPDTENIRLYKNPAETYRCTLVTPLYGGGVTAGVVDRKMPIRATSIRGQLRFWWRVAHKKNYLDADKKMNTLAMFQDERDLWGGLGDADSLAASKVMVSVRNTANKSLEACATYEKKTDGSFKTFPTWESWAGGTEGGYALFPGQGKAGRQGVEKEPAKLLKPGASWDLEIQYTDQCDQKQQQQVQTALRWWASFGSVGGRGRRGLGAAQIAGLSSVSPEEAKESGCTLILQQQQPRNDAIKAWKEGLAALQKFRQGVGVGRNPGSEKNRPGRSRWPEPDAIRRITEKNAPAHRPEHPAGDFFPRAQFGLPIIFHFKDREDPQDATLKPISAERMASPLIIRPYFKDEQWYPAALFIGLESDVLTALELVSGKTRSKVSAWPNTDAQKQAAVEAIHPLSGVLKALLKKRQKPLSPMSAFLYYFKDPQKYFKEK